MAIDVGLAGDERRKWFERREQSRATAQDILDVRVPASELGSVGVIIGKDANDKSAAEWLRGGHVSLADLARVLPAIEIDSNVYTELAEDIVYAPYLERQEAELRDVKAGESLALGVDFPYERVPGLSREMVERLASVKPSTLSAAGRIPGITPSALSALLVHARKLEREAAAA